MEFCHNSVRKRKKSLPDIDGSVKSLRSEPDDQTKKQNHSEIEKRRRDKMNTYITELSSIIPMCNAMSRKLDKLTVLRMAVQHMKTIRGSINSYSEGLYKPSFLSDEELKKIILKTAEGFLFVVSCDRGRILFVSESVTQVLNYSQNDLLGQSWFDILHPKDIGKVKEQLSSSDLSPKERLIDAKTMMPVRTEMPQTQIRFCPGARRSFLCRMKYKALSSAVKEEADTTTGMHRRRKHHMDRKYCVIHCTGYLKSWAPANLSIDLENDVDSDCNLSCLVAIGQVQHCLPNPVLKNNAEMRAVEFTSRHSMDGKFLFVDQRAFLVLGFIPQELQGSSCYDYFHQDDIASLADFHKQVLQSEERQTSPVYRFRRKEGTFAWLSSKWKTFRNPWTKELEYIIAVNVLVPVTNTVESSNSPRGEEFLNSNSNSLDAVLSYLPSSTCMGSTSKILGTRVGAGKIGRQIADEVLERQKGDSSLSNNLDRIQFFCDKPELEPPPLNDISHLPHYQTKPLMDGNIFSSPSPSSTSSMQMASHLQMADMDTVIGRDMLQASFQHSTSEGNDEAAMAVIMSLLEADAGLGGPVDFSGLPWPLP